MIFGMFCKEIWHQSTVIMFQFVDCQLLQMKIWQLANYPSKGPGALSKIIKEIINPTKKK